MSAQPPARPPAADVHGSAPARVPAQQAVGQLLRQYEPVVARLLDRTGIGAATFTAWVANACRATPKLWEVEPTTLLGAALRAAQLGLAPNTPDNLCFIIPRKGQAVWQLGYGGILELARRAVPGLIFEGRPVYPGDLYVVEYGSAFKFKHVPHTARRRPRGGDATAWYVLATYPDGRQYHHDLDREGVEYHRAFSEQPDGLLWGRSYDAAALKSVVIEMRRWLPNSATISAALAADGTVVDVRDMADEVEPVGADIGEIGPPEAGP